MEFNKLWDFGVKNASVFKRLSDQIAEEKFETDTDEAKLAVSYMAATLMTMGAREARDTHIAFGAVIGVVGTVATLKIKDKVKETIKKKKVEEIKEAFEEGMKQDLKIKKDWIIQIDRGT